MTDDGGFLRALDWSVYGRTERLLVKRFEEEEDLAIYFIVDASSSMLDVGRPSARTHSATTETEPSMA